MILVKFSRLEIQPAFLIPILVFIFLFSGNIVAAAQTSDEEELESKVEILTGHVEPDRSAFYLLPNLNAGDTLYAYAKQVSGNLDPFIAITERNVDPTSLRVEFWGEVQLAIDAGQDPLRVIPQFSNRVFLAWDDDSGEGYDSALAWTVPTDGDFVILVGGNVASNNAGDYQLTVGLNEPGVLNGDARPTGHTVAIPLRIENSAGESVDRTEGSITPGSLIATFPLEDRRGEETLFIYVEGLTGNLKPRVFLRDFGGKPIRTSNFAGASQIASLEYTFPGRAKGYQIEVSGENPDGSLTQGEFKLLVGVNTPAVLSGAAEVGGESILKLPALTEVTYQLDQISDVDQKAENYSVVASLTLDWEDPKLAFNPSSCQCRFKVFTYNDFVSFANRNDIQWPEFSIFNQQGNRWSQNRFVAVFSDGRASYFERFSVTLQAPDFNFRQFPFDRQVFKAHIDSVFPIEFVQFSDRLGQSGLGEQLGEEEWQITDFITEITVQDTPNVHSRFTIELLARREIIFYTVRFFIPILLIILVSWITFFLKNYTRRIEVTSANLLLFIAYNFTISSDLPRLGYLTFMDVLLMSTFLVSVLVVVFNVILRRLEIDGREELAQRIDKYSIWIYPLIYSIGFILVYNSFFVP